MKRRFLLLLFVLIVLVSFAAIFISNFTARKSMEKLIMERAANRLSIIVWGFNVTATDVDVYSYIDFDYEVLTITKDDFPVLQYGTAAIHPENPRLRRIERKSGSYDFTLYIDFDAELAKYLGPVQAIIKFSAAIYAILFAVFGWIFISLVADPIARLAAAMVKITSRNLRVRIPLPRKKDEIRQLISTFNAMMDDIAATYERQVQFVEDMSHDIATPVQILEGYRQLIERYDDEPRLVAEYLSVSKAQLARLREMIGMLATTLASERRRRVEHIDASAITEQNLRYYREINPDISFAAYISPGVSLSIAREDFERIEHILIDNAVKYGRDGKRIEITLQSGFFSVRDFGMGISESEIAIIFERYHRNPESYEKSKGLGLGLAILKRFSEEYGFQISVDSAPGKGSTFTLHFGNPPTHR